MFQLSKRTTVCGFIGSGLGYGGGTGAADKPGSDAASGANSAVTGTDFRFSQHQFGMTRNVEES